MENLNNYLEKFNKKKKKITKEQELADQIYSYFGKQLKFGLIMNFIKQKGFQFMYEVYNEIKHSNPKNREALFMWKIGKTKINFNNKIKPAN